MVAGCFFLVDVIVYGFFFQLSLEYMKGSTLDYTEDLMRAAFRIVKNPIATKSCSCGSSFAVKLD